MSAIEDKVCQLIQERASIGFKKYGVTVERKDLTETQWLRHALEEALDMAVYLMRIIDEKESGSIEEKTALESQD